MEIVDSKGVKYSINESLEIARGGEGRILPLNNGKVVKLYFDPSMAISQRKIDELSPLDNSIFLKPEIAVSGDANGFIMNELNSNEYFPLYSLFSSVFVMKHNLSSDFKMKIADKLVNAVKMAHDHNIVIGDLNPFNIMVNNNLDVKFIDVDSYQTPTYKHNDKLLEDIRDYAFNGVVSQNSDYFSLAVIIFNLFTYIHPYKGIHNLYGNRLKDRMINFCSVLSKEKQNIKIPKFYQPINDKTLNDVFSKIFDNGERFLLNLHGTIIQAVVFNGVVMSDSLIITDLFNEHIVNVTSSKNFISIVTSTHTIIFNTPAKGIVTNMINVSNDVSIILTDKNIIGLKDGIFKIYEKKTNSFKEITGLCIKNIYIIKQYENVLLIITKDDQIYKIFLDEVYNTSIKYTVSSVYHKSFHKKEGLYQHIGVNDALYYNTGADVSMLSINECQIEDIIQIGNVGILSTWKNNNKTVLSHELFTINKMGKIKCVSLPEKCAFTANDNFIILYLNDKLRFFNKETLVEVVSFNIDGIDDYSLLSTNSGIIAFNQNNLKLLNSK